MLRYLGIPSWRVALAGVIAVLGMLATPSARCATQAPVWEQWIADLRSQGFAVTQGVATLHDCATYVAVFGNCSGNNPSGGYYDILPPIDDTYVDPCYNPAHDCSGRTPSSYSVTATLADGSQARVNQFYRLGASDALVVIVNLPPNAAYFGYQSYVYSRPNSAYALAGCTTPSFSFPDPCRVPVRGSVGNSINNVSIQKQSGLSLRTGGTVAFITTANPALYSRLASEFQHVGGTSSLLFVEPLAQKIVAGSYTAAVNAGTAVAADELNTLLRYTIPQNPTAVTAWESSLPANVQVFRIRNASLSAQRYAQTVLAARHYSTDESGYGAAVSELTSDLQRWLQTMTTARVGIAPMTSYVRISKTTGLPLSTVGLNFVGPYCIAQGNDCLRDTQDTDSYRGRTIANSLDHTAAIVGVDSTQTGNATYIGVGVTDYSILEGVASLSQVNAQVTGFNSGTLKGSAADLVATLVASGAIPPPSATLSAALPKLFVALATRGCPSAAAAFYCPKTYTMQIADSQLPSADAVQLTRRSYVHPGDANGANPEYLYPTQVVY